MRDWLKRFNQEGLSGLEDRPRPGKPRTYQAEQRSQLVVTALTNPLELDLPFACWTLDRLQAYLNEEKGIPIKQFSRNTKFTREYVEQLKELAESLAS